MNKIEQLTQILKESQKIVFFGGAGCSSESGIPDFRSAEGLFNQELKQTFTPEQLVSHSFYVNHPEAFFDFYKEKLIYPEAKPNGAHCALAYLEKIGKLTAVVTQNIDGLHQAAGSKQVFELHGSVLRNYCVDCQHFYDERFILESKGIPMCTKCGGRVKPDVVLYEESLDEATIQGAIAAIAQADTLIIGGTSLVVYPAAGLIDYFRGKTLVLINKSATPADGRGDLVINEAIGEVLEQATRGV
ncbi:NAD-dependent protein deacylase [Enterococcus sp. LJL98]